MNALQVKIISERSSIMLQESLNKWLIEQQKQDTTILKINYTHTHILTGSTNISTFVAYIEYK